MNKVDTLGKTSKNLMLQEPYYGLFLIALNKVWSERLPTAGVSKNGINYQLAINPTFWEELSEDHRLGLLKHELLHIAFGHLSVFFSFSDRKMANIAMDMEINQYIDNSWLPGGNYTKEEVNAIKEEVQIEIAAARERDAPIEEIKAIASKIPFRGIMIDDYEELDLDRKAGCRYYYEKLLKAKDDKDKTGTSGSDAFDKLSDQMDSGGDGLPDHSTWEEFEDLTEAEQKLIDKQVQRIMNSAKEQTLKTRGKIPGEMEDKILLEEIVKPKFNWRGYIKRFTGVSTKIFTKKTRRKENIRFSDNPGIKIKMRQKMLLAIDTSGSVVEDELKEFMNEIYHIYNAGVDVTIIQCDTHIRSIVEYKGNFELGVLGRGGTDFDPVLKYYQDNRQFTSLIYFTDGECTTNLKPSKQILWVISERSELNTKLPGKVIKLEL
jgi:predicted metal-dependent peptidase